MNQKLFNIGLSLGYIIGILSIIHGLIYLYIFFQTSLGMSISPYFLYGGKEDVLYIVPSYSIGYGIIDICLFYFGIRNGQIWCWFLKVFYLLAIPLQQFALQLKNNYFPISFATLTLTIFALVATAPHLFKTGKLSK